MMKPLSVWTGKKRDIVIEWTERMNAEFEKLKEIPAMDVELGYPDYSASAKPLKLYTNASGYCMGGCLMQEQAVNGEEMKRGVGYVSKEFDTAERRYSTIEREIAAVTVSFV